ncbi:probable disease resistance protein At5g43740 [Arachis duranensis]|uniref:Probable disease resistance protein At5g43740 n=1 Tax=Arachis duranensis TaxID=130453 RepID=A0A6P4DK31_ARADU|nr:probable disease resistance protein At5g43740 [Arachis duranensis]
MVEGTVSFLVLATIKRACNNGNMFAVFNYYFPNKPVCHVQMRLLVSGTVILKLALKKYVMNLAHGKNYMRMKGNGWSIVATGKKYKNNDGPEKVEALKEEACRIIDLLHQDALQDPQKETDDFESKLTELNREMPSYLDYSFVNEYFTERDLLRDDNVFFIGICGMGGMGKTWLVTHFRSQIRWKKNFNFENVYWVTESQDFSILKLQDSIVKRIGEKLDDEDEIIDRAEVLSCALGKIDRLVLILDDVWNYIDLQKVGIPQNKWNQIDSNKSSKTCVSTNGLPRR